MILIPKHCIDKFKEKFNQYPSHIEVEGISTDKVDKIFKKSHLIWFSSKVIDQKIINVEKLFEFDVTGIYVYVNNNIENEKNVVTFLTTIDRENVTNYTINQLIK